MKGIDTQLAGVPVITDLDNDHHIDPFQLERVHLHNKILDMFQLPKATKERNILDDVFHFTPSLDYCDNEVQAEILRHHYTNEFVHPVKGEFLRDYCEDSVIHKIVDDQPATYRGKDGAIDAWHDLSSYIKESSAFDLKHVSVCRNHAQVNWEAEVNEPKHMIVYGRDTFTFDNANHISMQTTVALSQKDGA